MAPAAAMTPATLIDADLQSRSVLVNGLRDGRISFFDDDRTLRTLESGEFLQLRFDVEIANEPAESTMWLVLTDGRRLRGKLMSVEENGQVLHWRHSAMIQEARVDLEEIAALVMEDAVPTFKTEATSDRVVLANGDVLEGFVAAVSLEAISLQRDDAAEAQALPWERIARVEFANGTQPRSHDKHRVLLADGSELSAQDLVIESGQLAMRGALPGRDDLLQSIPLTHVRQIDVAGDATRLVQLVSLPSRVTGGGEVFGRTMKPRLQNGALHLHAPIRVTLPIPPGTRRFAARAVLDLHDESGAVLSGAEWADLDLIVYYNGRELARHHLHANHPEAQLNLPLDDREEAGELIIELAVGANGPIMDRLHLLDAVLLVQPR